MSIQDRFNEIQNNIREFAGKQPVTVIAVSKYATVEQMVEAYQAGIRHFGENKVQDALSKIAVLPSEFKKDVHWHFIGSLQTNKVKKTIGHFERIHSVDSLHLAAAISKANEEEQQKQAILIQVNSTGDPSRHGVLPAQTRELLPKILALPGITVRGFMTLAPGEASITEDITTLERVFCGLRDLRNELTDEFAINLPDLSMGMSHDYVHALKCGATIIRIGNMLFKN
jgi:hypothetical protein